MPVASDRPDQNPRAVASQPGPEGSWPTGARWRAQCRRPRHRMAAGEGVWVGEVGCVCVVWCCCCKSMPSYFLIPSIAVLFCYWHQTPPATPLLCCLSPRPAAQTKQQPPQQARSRQQPAGQHAAIYRASSAVRLRGFVAPSSAGLDRAVAVSVAGAVVVRQPAAVPKHDDGKLRRAAEYFLIDWRGEADA